MHIEYLSNICDDIFNSYKDIVYYKEQLDRLKLSRIYHDEYIYNEKEFYDLVKKYDIDWIIVDKNNEYLINYVQNANIQKDCESLDTTPALINESKIT